MTSTKLNNHSKSVILCLTVKYGENLENTLAEVNDLSVAWNIFRAIFLSFQALMTIILPSQTIVTIFPPSSQAWVTIFVYRILTASKQALLCRVRVLNLFCICWLQHIARKGTLMQLFCVVVYVFAGTPSQTGSATLLVTVTDANDNAPSLVFDPSVPLVVPASTTNGQRVLCFNATSPNVLQNPVYQFNYVCNSPHCTDFSLSTVGKYRTMWSIYT